MIIYERHENEIIAHFKCKDKNTDFWQWVEDITLDVSERVSPMLETMIQEIAIRNLMPKSNFSGKAKCHPDDEFDEKVGKKIASKRLMEKYYKYRDVVLEQTIQTINEIPHVYRHLYVETRRKTLCKQAQNILNLKMLFLDLNDIDIYKKGR